MTTTTVLPPSPSESSVAAAADAAVPAAGAVSAAAVSVAAAAAPCSCEASPPSYLDSQHPLATRADLDLRVRQLVPCALERQLWLLMLDGDDIQMPVLVPIGELDDLPRTGAGGCDPGIDRTLTMIDREFGVASFVFVYERPGGDVLDRSDLAWLSALFARSPGAVHRVRGVYLAHDAGVGGFEPDDREVVSAGDLVPTIAAGCLRGCPG